MLARKVVVRGEFQRKGLQRHWVVVIQNVRAEGEEVASGFHPPDFVKESTGWFHAEADEIHVLLHSLHVHPFRETRSRGGLVQSVDVSQQLLSAGNGSGQPSKSVADLLEQPRIPY